MASITAINVEKEKLVPGTVFLCRKKVRFPGTRIHGNLDHFPIKLRGNQHLRLGDVVMEKNFFFVLDVKKILEPTSYFLLTYQNDLVNIIQNVCQIMPKTITIGKGNIVYFHLILMYVIQIQILT